MEALNSLIWDQIKNIGTLSLPPKAQQLFRKEHDETCVLPLSFCRHSYSSAKEVVCPDSALPCFHYQPREAGRNTGKSIVTTPSLLPGSMAVSFRKLTPWEEDGVSLLITPAFSSPLFSSLLFATLRLIPSRPGLPSGQEMITCGLLAQGNPASQRKERYSWRM